MIDDVCRKCGVPAVFSESYLQEVIVVALYRAYEPSIGFLFLLVKYFQTGQRSFVAFCRCLIEHERSNCLKSFNRELTTLKEREIIILMIVFLNEYLLWKINGSGNKR